MGFNKNKNKNKNKTKNDKIEESDSEETNYSIIKTRIIKKNKCVIDDSEEDENVLPNKKPKKPKNNCLIDDSEEDENVFMKKKPKKKKKKLIYDPDDNSPEYVARLIGIIDRTARSYEKKIEGTQPQFLLSNMTMIKSMEEASYYILTRRKMEYKCGNCDMGPVWNGKILRLLLDHINKQNDDYTLENLRFLCPNCCVQLKGRDTIGEFTKKATKNTCMVCNRSRPAKKMAGGKCKDCIELESMQRMLNNDYRYREYTKNNNNSGFDVNNAANEGMFKMHDIHDPSLAVHNIMALQHLENENKKSKYRPKKKKKSPEDKKKTNEDDIGHKVKRPQNNNLDFGASLFNQLLNKKNNKNDKNDKNEEKDEIKDKHISIDIDDMDDITEDGQLEMVIEKDTKKKSHGFTFDF